MHAKRSIMSLRPVAVAVLSLGVLASGHAVAGEDDTPLSLTLAQYLSRDNNFAKDDSFKVGETVSTSVAQVGFNKAYGRQTYRASAKLSAQRYKNYDQFNNDGKDVSGSFATEFLRDWLISANGAYNESLNAVQNNAGTDRFVRNVKKYRDGGFSVQYGNGGTWAIAGSYDSNKQTYSNDAQKYQDANQTTKGVKAIYFASDVLNYSFGTRRVVTNYTDPRSPYVRVADKNIDLSTNWQITGLSNLSATITHRSTSYTPDDLAGSSGWTGSANWGYTPQGLVSYNFAFSRTTGTDRSMSSQYSGLLVSKINSDTVTTTVGASARAQLTGKVAATLGYSVAHFEIDRNTLTSGAFSGLFPGAGSQATSSYNHTASLGLEYAALRSLSMGCSYQRYSQGADVYRLYRYHGNSVDCNANFTID